MPNRKELIELDFHEHDTKDALNYLMQLCEEGAVAGIVFGVVGKRGSRPLFGATGRLASNPIEAAGISAILQGQFTKPYISAASE